MDSKTKTPTKS